MLLSLKPCASTMHKLNRKLLHDFINFIDFTNFIVIKVQEQNFILKCILANNCFKIQNNHKNILDFNKIKTANSKLLA